MSNKVRIYELSKELDLENKEILAFCDQLNIEYKSHSSTITEAEAAQIRDFAAKNPRPQKAHSPSKPRQDSQSPAKVSKRKPVPQKPQILEVRRLKPKPAVREQRTEQPTESVPPRPLTSPPKAASVTKPTAPVMKKANKVDEPSAASVAPTAVRESQPTLISKPRPKRSSAPNPPTETVRAPASVPVTDELETQESAAPSPVLLKKPSQIKPPTRPAVQKESTDQDSSETGEDLEGTTIIMDDGESQTLKLKRPSINRPKRYKPESSSSEDDDMQALLGKSSKTKQKRRNVRDEEEDDDLFGDDAAAQNAAVDVSQSLVRPPKPKSQKAQARPAAVTSRPSAPSRGGSRRQSRSRDRQQRDTVQERPEIITLTSPLSLQELAKMLMVPETEVIKILFLKGIAANINQTLDIPTATMVAEELEVMVETAEEESEAKKVTEMLDVEDLENLHRRPPVVTIMGHVDHGKTTLLDSIRETKVAQGEAGGITQHIGAYHVDLEHNGLMQQVVFLDTPGHEAFTAMRARGARVTDLAILVVAADDGVRPQTIEAISHAQAAKVPIIVAINKMDKETAQPDRVKQELTEYNLVPEEWGGDAIMVPVSALKGENLDTLLEMILLVSEVEDLQANPDRPAKGTVIEANLDKARGPVATLLVQNGTLRVGDIVVVGSVFGKVRAMIDDRGQRVDAALPSFAVEILGLNDVPAAGEEFEVLADEKSARAVASNRADEQRQSRLQQAMASRRISLGSLSDQVREGELKELNLVLKADVQGSVEAILASLGQLPQNEVQVRVLLSAPGEVTETDVDLAAASNAVIIGFNTSLASGARQAADEASVDIREYNVIYKLLEDIQAAMEGLLDPELVSEPLGQTEVRAVFSVGRGAVAGCYVQSGKLIRNCRIRVMRDGEQVFEGILDSLKRMKDDVKEVNAGYECGIGVDSFNDWKEGDLIEAYQLVTKRRTLAMA